MYIIRKSSPIEKINGLTVVFHGEKAERLAKGLLNESTGEIVDCPLTDNDLHGLCNMSFVKDGKPIYTQVGTAKLVQLKNGNVVGKHQVKWAKDGALADYVVVWLKQGGGFWPKYKIPADEGTFTAVKGL
jgi:hypothetical protein